MEKFSSDGGLVGRRFLFALVATIMPDVNADLKRTQLCAVKGADLQRVKVPPGNWSAPPGSNRSGGGGNEAAEASDGKGRTRRLRESVGRNVSER